MNTILQTIADTISHVDDARRKDRLVAVDFDDGTEPIGFVRWEVNDDLGIYICVFEGASNWATFDTPWIRVVCLLTDDDAKRIVRVSDAMDGALIGWLSESDPEVSDWFLRITR